MSKKLIIICAEYLVILEGGLFFWLSLQTSSFIDQVNLLVTGGMLLIIALSVSKILKRFINKSRSPKMEEFFIPHDAYAFPSGHATGLASISTFIFFHNTMLGILAFVITLITVVARVKSYVHDTHDIIAGTILGVVLTYLLTDIVSLYVTTYLVPAFFS